MLFEFCCKFDQSYLHVVAGKFGVRNQPLVVWLGPLRAALNLHVLSRGYELVDYKMLEPNFAGQLPNAVHKIFALTVDHLAGIIQFTLGLLEPVPYPFCLMISVNNLLLYRPELLVDVQFHLLLVLQVLLHQQLLTPPLLEHSLVFEKLLLLFHDFFHGFVSLKELLLHVFDLAQELLLLRFRLLRACLL